MNNQQFLIMNKNINLVFNVDSEGRTNLYPPSQMFVNENFKFLISIGGALVDNEQQYNNLMIALRSIGENCLHIVEYKRKDDREPPVVGELPIGSNYDILLQLEHAFEPMGDWLMENIFVYGDNPNWGIYICEYPTILIIGCIEEYVPLFKDVYEIEGNGFAQRDNFIRLEYGNRPHLRDELIKNYHLMDDDSVNGQNNQPINV